MTIDQTREPTPEEVLELIRATARGALRGLMPARVESYDAAAQTVTVTPAIRRRRADESYTDDPTLTVPWRCLRVGACAVHLEPSAGDWVGLLVGERSLDEWMGGARLGIEPADVRRFDLSDAIAYPLLTPDGGEAPATRIEVRADGVVTITAAEVRLGDDSATPLALASDVQGAIDDLWAAMVALYTWGAGVTPTLPAGPVFPATVDAPSVAATKTKGV
jgi:hypothetical protein